MSFAGLSVLTMILRQILGGQLTTFDSFVARSWIQLGFMVTFGSFLPPLLALADVPTPMVWRIPSANDGDHSRVLGFDIPGAPARDQPDAPVPVMIFLAAMILVALALAASATAVPVAHLPGIYAASATAILLGAAMLFLFAFVHWYDALL
jgi:hypothetical protein